MIDELFGDEMPVGLVVVDTIETAHVQVGDYEIVGVKWLLKI